MINIDLISNIQDRFTENINSKNGVNYTKTSEGKDDFKSFLKNEVKNDMKIEDKSVDLNSNTEKLTNTEKSETKEIKEILETSLEKIKAVIDGTSKDDDIEAEDIIEVINLLSNLLVIGDSKIDTEINAKEIVDSNLLIEGNLENIKNLISEVKEIVSNFEENTSSNVYDKDSIENLKSLGELINTMLETDKNSTEINLDKENINKEILNLLNFISRDNSKNTTFNVDNKGIIENLNSLGNLINNILETGEESTNINLDKKSLNKEILNLLNSISKKDVEKFKLSENQSNIKEIVSSLVNIKNYNENLEVIEEPITLDKENINLKDIMKINVQSNSLQSENNNSEFESFFKENTDQEVKEDITEEDKILSKFLVEDNKGTIGNISTSYDSFKNNSVDFIQKPEFINSQTMDDDIIKSSSKETFNYIKSLLSEVEGLANNLDVGTNINKETLNLLNSILEKDVEIFKLPENQNRIKEIISSLVNIKNYNENFEVIEEPITLDKESLKINDDIKINIKSNILESESNNSEFENVLTSYDIFKNNLVDVIQTPEFINSQTMDNDIIKDFSKETINDIKSLLSEGKDLVNNLEVDTNINLDNIGIENLKYLDDSINSMLEESNEFSNLSLDKENINLKDIIKINSQSDSLQSESNNSEFENFFKENIVKEVKEDIKEEDKTLSKFLINDNKGSFTNILTHYDIFKNNSVDVIQKPEFINSQTMDNDIIKSVKYMMKNNMEELTVKVYPKELGELTIKILSEEGIMKAEIKATSKEAYSILNANVAEIKNSLSDQNIKIQDVQISIYNNDTTFFSGKEHSRENQKDGNKSNSKLDYINLDENENLIIENKIESNVNLLA